MSSLLKILSGGPQGTQQLGQHLGQMARPGDVFLLTGTLGAGKTHLAQGIAWGVGVQEYARSPTFVIVNRYQGHLTMYHIDLFRIQDPAEVWDLGLEEYLGGDGVSVVEWANNAPELFSPESTWIDLTYGAGEMERYITLQVGQQGRSQMLKDLKKLLKKEEQQTPGSLCLLERAVER